VSASPLAVRAAGTRESTPTPESIPPLLWGLLALVALTAAGPFLIVWLGSGKTHESMADGVSIATAVVTLWAAAAALLALLYANRTVRIAHKSDTKLQTTTQELEVLVDRIESLADRENQVVAVLDRQLHFASRIDERDINIRLAAERVRVLENLAAAMSGTYAASRTLVGANVRGSDALRVAGNELLRQHSYLDAQLLLLPSRDLPGLRKFAQDVYSAAEIDDVSGVLKACADADYIADRTEYRRALRAARDAFQRSCRTKATGTEAATSLP